MRKKLEFSHMGLEFTNVYKAEYKNTNICISLKTTKSYLWLALLRMNAEILLILKQMASKKNIIL